MDNDTRSKVWEDSILLVIPVVVNGPASVSLNL